MKRESRDINDLHPELARRFKYLKDNWNGDNELILTSTYRSKQRQAELWDLYKNHNGPKSVPPGYSLHNYYPALAFDVAFITPSGVADYSWPQFAELGRRGRELGLTWGGDWPSADGPHFQFPMRWQEAAASQEPPKLPPLPNHGHIRDQLEKIREQLLRMLKKIKGR